MDILSLFLLIWVLGSVGVLFIIHNVLPYFLPPNIGQTSSITEQRSTSGRFSLEKSDATQQQDQPFAALSNWAASTLGVNIGQQAQIGETCGWVNDVLIWLHTHVRHSPVLASGWLRAMNDASSKVAQTVGCDVYYEEVIPSQDLQNGPRVTDIRSEFGPREHLTIRANLTYPQLSVRVVASQKLTDRLLVSNYSVLMTNLSGQIHVRIACIGDDLFFMGCFEGKPDVTVSLDDGDQGVERRVDPNLVQEVIRRSMASAVTNVSLAKLREQPLTKRVVVNGNAMTDVSPAEIIHSQASTMQERKRSNRLLLKVDKAHNLGGGNSVPSQPYVVVEVDEPAQKHTTTLGYRENPIWEEQFMFDLNEKSEEILFEVYDRRTQQLGDAPVAMEEEPRFLGLAIVGIEELRQSQVTSHTLTLQARPYTKETVRGTLVAEFIFLRENIIDNGAGPQREKKNEVEQLHVITDFQPVSGGMKTALDSPFIDSLSEEQHDRRPTGKIRDQTPLTSDSELSVTSTDSVYAQSQLVVELTEDGVRKYYYLPVSVQRHSTGKRLMKSGKKLHIYNDHTFTTVKVKNVSTCAVCDAIIGTAFRRKGYQCRDCGLISHKRCHFKASERCPFSKVSILPIEIVKLS